jgi:hypothetical protein
MISRLHYITGFDVLNAVDKYLILVNIVKNIEFSGRCGGGCYNPSIRKRRQVGQTFKAILSYIANLCLCPTPTSKKEHKIEKKRSFRH